MAASPMRKNAQQERIKRSQTKRPANQIQDTCRSYKRTTANINTAVRCYHSKIQSALTNLKTITAKAKKWI